MALVASRKRWMNAALVSFDGLLPHARTGWINMEMPSAGAGASRAPLTINTLLSPSEARNRVWRCMMPDVWSAVAALDGPSQERLADVLETRGADAQQRHAGGVSLRRVAVA